METRRVARLIYLQQILIRPDGLPQLNFLKWYLLQATYISNFFQSLCCPLQWLFKTVVPKYMASH